MKKASDQSRRMFLASMAAIAASGGPVLLSGCRRKVAAPVPLTRQPVDLDEVDDGALTRPGIPTVEPSVRVRVLKVRTPGTFVRIGSENQWIRLHREGTPGQGVALYGPLLAGMESGGWSITDGKGFRADVQGREVIELARLDDDAGALLQVAEVVGGSSATMPASAPASARMYPGTLRLVPRPDLQPDAAGAVTAFDMVNHVPVEQYLPGVLSGELYKNWQLETHAAQAVAARSFAATEAAVFSGRRHYDVSNSAASQMYVGEGHAKAREAVTMTRGLMLGYQGLLVSGYYSSCCGGVAASASDAIGSNAVNDALPLQGRSGADVCVGTPRYQWKIDQSIELLSRRVAAYAQEKKNADLLALVRLESIGVTASNANGRPRMITLTDTRGRSATLGAEEFRRAANYSGQGLNPPEKPLLSSNVSATFSRTTVTFEGFGFGHGVGLCQYGAEVQAKAGKGHREIVQWYYPDADLVTAYA